MEFLSVVHNKYRIKATTLTTESFDGYSVRQIIGIMIKILKRKEVEQKDTVDQAGKPMKARYEQEVKLLEDLLPKLNNWPLL